uniref:Small ribosomal subunit protein uS3m n=1 Tax=Fomitopsis palustris TaxID=2870670 RepID=A0A1V1FYP1_9APHY|nr:ribosomal protein S3 [Fomitopsis palustris]BAX08588.1 ribosomal protein S3 [Fomitopsis palustris]
MIKNLEENYLKTNLTMQPYGSTKFNVPSEILNNSYENLLTARKEVEPFERITPEKFRLKTNKISEFNKNLKIFSLGKNNKEASELIKKTKKINNINSNLNQITKNKVVVEKLIKEVKNTNILDLQRKEKKIIEIGTINNINQFKYSEKNKFNSNEITKNLNYLLKFDPYLAQSQHIYYFFKKSNSKLIKNISSILEYSFLKMYSLISKPVYYITPDNLYVNLFFFRLKNKKNKKNKKSLSSLFNLNSQNLEILSANLSNFISKNVHFDLNRIRKLNLDSNILAHFIARYCDFKKIKFSKIAKRVLRLSKIKNSKKYYSYNGVIPSFLTGIKIKLGGRLSTQKISARQTVKITQRGSLTRRNTDLVSKSRITGINKKGTFCVTVTIGQKIFI